MSWQTLGVSVIGSSHIKTDKPCQDSHAFRPLSEDVLLIAVADGLGSADLSQVGSRLAVDAALDALEAAGPGADDSPEGWVELLAQAFATARRTLEERAAGANVDLRDLGTTLICVVLAPEWAACGQVGDGAVVARTQDGALALLSAPQRGEYANETVPLTTRNALELVRYSTHTLPMDALAVISDGLQNLSLLSTDYTPFDKFFNPFFDMTARTVDLEHTRAHIEEFFGSERVCARTDDDKTLVVAARPQPQPIEEEPDEEPPADEGADTGAQ